MYFSLFRAIKNLVVSAKVDPGIGKNKGTLSYATWLTHRVMGEILQGSVHSYRSLMSYFINVILRTTPRSKKSLLNIKIKKLITA